MSQCTACGTGVDADAGECVHCGRTYCPDCRSPRAHSCPSHTTSEGNLQMAQRGTPVDTTVDVPTGSLQRWELALLALGVAVVVLLWLSFGP